MKKISIALFFYLALLPAMLYAQNEDVRLQLKWWHQFQFAGYYAAQIKGFYKQAGLNVTIIAGDKEHPPVQEVLKGHADFGVTGSDLMLNYIHGDRVQALGVIFQHSAYALISPQQNNITQPHDLIGKRIMASRDQGWVQLMAVFLQQHIDTNLVTVIPHTWNNNDILNGHADAMSGYSSVEVNQLEARGVKVNTIMPFDYGIDFYGDILFALKDKIARDPSLTERFIDASFKGWEYAMSHPQEIAAYILTLPGVKERGVTLNSLLEEEKKMEPLVMPGLVEVGHMNESRWEHMLKVYQSLNIVPKEASVQGFIYDRHQRSMNKVKTLALYALLLVIGILSLLLVYSFSLKKAVRRRTIDLEKEIAERKKKEAALELLSRELQASNNELQQFAYLSSHNLRAPVINLVSLVKLFDKNEITGKNSVYLEKIESSTDKLSHLLNDLNEILSVRKTESSEFTELSFEKELATVSSLLSQSIAETNSAIWPDFHKCPSVFHSRKILQSILLNLITNAIKYRKPGEPAEIQIESYKDEENVYLLVKDHGIGIDLEKHGDKIFNIYQRFNPEIEGKGLGLYLIRSQLEKTGGTIKVESQLNKGCTFTISFKKEIR